MKWSAACFGLCVTLLVVAGLMFMSYNIGRRHGEHFGRNQGYVNGQLDLVEAIHRELGYSVTEETYTQSYKHFRDVKYVSLYILEKNGVKTIAVWE